MLIKNIMLPTNELTTVSLHQSAQEALALIDSKQLLSLPVVEGNRFVGIISKRYILEEYFNTQENKETFLARPVADFMKTKIQCLAPNDLVEEPLKLLCEHNVQFIPIVDEQDNFAGIVTHKSVFSVFRDALGIGNTRLAITTYNMKGQLAKLAEIIAKEGGNILSIVQVDPQVMHLKELILRIDLTHTDELIKTLNEHGFTVRRVD